MAKKAKKAAKKAVKKASKGGSVAKPGIVSRIAGGAASLIGGGGSARGGGARTGRRGRHGPNWWANRVLVEKLKKRFYKLKYSSR